MFARQLRVMEMKIVTTEAGTFGPIFSPGHLEGTIIDSVLQMYNGLIVE